MGRETATFRDPYYGRNLMHDAVTITPDRAQILFQTGVFVMQLQQMSMDQTILSC